MLNLQEPSDQFSESFASRGWRQMVLPLPKGEGWGEGEGVVRQHRLAASRTPLENLSRVKLFIIFNLQLCQSWMTVGRLPGNCGRE